MKSIFIQIITLYLGLKTVSVTCQDTKFLDLTDFDLSVLPQSSPQDSAQCITAPICDPACPPGEEEFILPIPPPCGQCLCKPETCQPPSCECPPGFRVGPFISDDICEQECQCERDPDSCPQPFCICEIAGFLPTIYNDPESGCPLCDCAPCPQPPLGCEPGYVLSIYTDPESLCPVSQCLEIECPEVSCSCLPSQTQVDTMDVRGCPTCSCGPPCTYLECSCIDIPLVG